MPALPSAQRARSGNGTSIDGTGLPGAASFIATARGFACAPRSSTDAQLVAQPAHECLAERELLARDPFVGLMGLRDVAGSADDRRDVRAVEERGLRAERD